MMRLAAAILLAVIVAFPLTLLPSPPITWLAVGALVAGGAGVVMLSVPLVTIGGALTLIAYALALVIVRRPSDPVIPIAFGATLVLLLALVHFASHTQGAAIGRSVIVSELRRWLAVVAGGAAVAIALKTVGAELAPLLRGAALPVVVVVAGLGTLATVAGVIALVTTREDTP